MTTGTTAFELAAAPSARQRPPGLSIAVLAEGETARSDGSASRTSTRANQRPQRLCICGSR